MQWYIKQPPVSQLLEGAEFIYCNFHCLTSGDLVGYPAKAYLPGLVLVGDAGGFSQVVDNFGANVAQVMGKIAGELAAEMKAKKDYSEAMFAKYDERLGRNLHRRGQCSRDEHVDERRWLPEARRCCG